MALGPDVLFRAWLMTLPGTGSDHPQPLVLRNPIVYAKERERNGFSGFNLARPQTKTRRSSMFGPARFRVVAIGFLAGILAAEVPVPASSATELRHAWCIRSHSKYGDIGSYMNVVEKDADSTTVSTQGRIKVSLTTPLTPRF